MRLAGSADGTHAGARITRSRDVADLSDVVASATRQARRQRPEGAVFAPVARYAPTTLDAIPDLPRPLVRLRAETPANTDVQSSARAVRLLASQGFAAEKLRRAVEDVQGESDGLTGIVGSWVDDDGPWGAKGKGSAEAVEADLEACSRAEILAHAEGHLRLDANVAFRDAMQDAMERDLAMAKEDLLSMLAARVDPSAAIPSPFMDSMDVHPLSAARSTRANAGSASSAGSRPALSGRSVMSDQSFPSQSPYRRGKSPLLSSTRRPRAGQPSTRNVAPTAPDPNYVSIFRDLVLGLDQHDMIATRLLEHAVESQDNPHFIGCLSVLVELSNLAGCDANADGASRNAGLSTGQDASGAVFPTQSHIISSSRFVLETLFLRYIATVTDVDLDSDSTIAAVRSGVHGYVSHLAALDTLLSPVTTGEQSSDVILVDNQPLWAQIYFCLRCGCPEAALEVATAADADLEMAGSRFLYYLHEFLTGKREAKASIPGVLRDPASYDALADEYLAIAYSSDDPYHRACYVLLSRLEIASPDDGNGGGMIDNSAITGTGRGRHHSASAVLRGLLRSSQGSSHSSAGGRASLKLPEEDYASLFGSVEDYFWLRLWQCRLPEEGEMIAKVQGVQYVVLSQIQNEVVQCGRAHFDPHGDNPVLFAFVLSLTGLLWQAIEFLASQQNAPMLASYAAYLALPLQAMKWVPGEADYASILWAFVLHFAADYPEEAVICMYTLRDMSMLNLCLQKLILDTGEYTKLLGDGKGEVGTIEVIASEITDMERARGRLRENREVPHYHSTRDGNLLASIMEFKREIASRLAAEYADCARDGMQMDSGSTAALFFAICGDKRAELFACLWNLAQRVASRENDVLRGDAVQAARRLLDTDGSLEIVHDEPSSEKLKASFQVLLKMAEFFDVFWSGQSEEAWSRLVAMEALPMKQSEIRDRQASFSQSGRFDACVVELLPDVLRAALEIAEVVLCGGGSAHGSTCRKTNSLGPSVDQVMTLITFAGLMGLAETELNARLVRLELLLA